MWKGLKKEPGSPGKAFPCCTYHCAQNTATQVHTHTDAYTHIQYNVCIEYIRAQTQKKILQIRTNIRISWRLYCTSRKTQNRVASFCYPDSFLPFSRQYRSKLFSWKRFLSTLPPPLPIMNPVTCLATCPNPSASKATAFPPNLSTQPYQPTDICCQIHNFPVSPLVFTFDSANICFP